jgi:hypothetical protein
VNWADCGALSGGRSHPTDGNDNDDSESEEHMQGGEKGPGQRKKQWMGRRNGREK